MSLAPTHEFAVAPRRTEANRSSLGDDRAFNDQYPSFNFNHPLFSGMLEDRTKSFSHHEQMQLSNNFNLELPQLVNHQSAIINDQSLHSAESPRKTHLRSF